MPITGMILACNTNSASWGQIDAAYDTDTRYPFQPVARLIPGQYYVTVDVGHFTFTAEEECPQGDLAEQLFVSGCRIPRMAAFDHIWAPMPNQLWNLLAALNEYWSTKFIRLLVSQALEDNAKNEGVDFDHRWTLRSFAFLRLIMQGIFCVDSLSPALVKDEPKINMFRCTKQTWRGLQKWDIRLIQCTSVSKRSLRPTSIKGEGSV